MEVLKFTEAEPASYPTLPVYDGNTVEDLIVVDRGLWRRLESYISYRWTPRACTWIVQGPGDFTAHLAPLSAVTVDIWDTATLTWSSVIAEPSPLDGFYLPRCETYRITGTVGATADPVPSTLVSAYQRLEAYHADTTGAAGSSQFSQKLGESGLDETYERSPNWIARALQNSGAADLLRSYRVV